MISSQVFLLSTNLYLNPHLFFCVVITLFHALDLDGSKGQEIRCLVLIGVSIFCFGYVQLLHEALQDRAFFNTKLDLIVGVGLIFLALESSRLSMGLFMTILSVAVVIYGFLWQYLPEPFTCQTLHLEQTIASFFRRL